ncbi:hypothetical protein [Natrarchaeobaculum sulfurireducens]|nr:hypothetical protein [Natrarchaeobaculum sulfurireducens]
MFGLLTDDVDLARAGVADAADRIDGDAPSHSSSRTSEYHMSW